MGSWQIIQAFSTKSWGGFVWALIIGLVLLIGGIATWVNPVLATLSLTLVVGAVFLAKGVFQVVMAFPDAAALRLGLDADRRHPVDRSSA